MMQYLQGRKPYWKKPQFWMICVIGLFLLAGGAYYYVAQCSAQKAKASDLYDSLMMSLQTEKFEEGRQAAQTLIAHYPKTIYAPFAALFLAKWDVENKDWAAAEKQLRFILQNTQKSPLPEIATLRLARVLSEQKNYAEALNLLDKKKPASSYVASYEETKGDIYWLQQNIEQAREAYLAAGKALPPGAPAAGRLQLKQVELGLKQTTDEEGN